MIVSTVTQAFAEFTSFVLPRYAGCRPGTIHGDLNDYNIIATDDGRDVGSFIDFGDIVRSYTVNDVAVCAAYFMLRKEDPLSGARVCLKGPNSSDPALPPSPSPPRPQ